MKKAKRYYAIIFMMIILGLWELLVHIFNINSHILPPPSAIIICLITNLDILLKHSIVTLSESIIGLLLAIMLSIVVGIVMDQSKVIKNCLYPHLIITQMIPVMVLGPLFTMWFGFGYLPKILMVIMMCFFPMIITFYDSLQQCNQEMIHLLKSYGASKLQLYRYIKIPAILPSFISSIKVSATYCVSGAIVGEWLNSSRGLGYYMIRAKNGFMMDKVFACIVMIILLSLLLNLIVSVIEKVVIPYQKKG